MPKNFLSGIIANTLRITSGSPDAGRVLTATDTSGNTTWQAIPTVTSSSVASSATPTPTGSSDMNRLYVTAQAANAVIGAPTGTPVNGNKFLIRIIPTGTYTLAYNAIFDDHTGIAPASMTNGKTITLGGEYDSTAAKWNILAVSVKP